MTSGFGKYETAPDQVRTDSIWAYVVVGDSVNHTFVNVQSDTIGPLEMSGQPKFVAFSAYSEIGELINSYILPEHWRYTIHEWKDRYRGFLTLNSSERIQAKPNYISSLEKKFWYWNPNISDILHYNTFFIESSTDEIRANYNAVKGDVVIKTYLPGGLESEQDSIYFKDPWVVDTTDSRFYTAPYGYHSLGMNTPFLSEPSPLHLTFASKYQGVFLNKIPDPSHPEKPYYSVRALPQQVISFHEQPITWYFQQWSGAANEVAFQYPNQTETAVVFKQDGAVARAEYKGHLVSNSVQATAFNNGRQIAYEYDYPASRRHLVCISIVFRQVSLYRQRDCCS